MSVTEEEWLVALAKECHNCVVCSPGPCDACQAGGVCDARCVCDDEDGAYEAQGSDDLDSEGELP